MLAVLKSLSFRFWLSVVLALAIVVALARAIPLLTGWAVQLPTAAIAFLVLVGALWVFFWLFYQIAGLILPTPGWRTRKLQYAPPAIALSYAEDSGPYWNDPAEAPARGTLSRFLAQHRGEIVGDDTKLRIGIVLSGGGAKGVYQAGALKALWEFLSREEALPYVRAVTGTSIGSWNAMFWLTNQVQDDTLRDWWLSAEPKKIIGPTFYLPLLSNHVLHNRPWRGQFDELFRSSGDRLLSDQQPFYYFTRANVRRARLEFTSNRGADYCFYRATETGYERGKHVIDEAKGQHRVEDFEDLKQAVFTSMDIPPAFARMKGPTGDECEDGGIVDNLPIRYATRNEGCNLLFVFALNATFERALTRHSILSRMSRVMDVRQGVLERGAIRDISLYNEVILAGRNVGRDIHIKPVTTFCICPDRPLDVGTFEFWKTRSAGQAAYSLMYEATRAELARFDFSLENRQVWMARVNSDGEIGYTDFTVR